MPEGDGLEALSVKELRRELANRKLDATGCLEKAELVDHLRRAGQAQRISTPMPPTPAQQPYVASSPGLAATNAVEQQSTTLSSLPVAELRRLLKVHGVEEATGAKEKLELVAAVSRCLQRCPICLDDAEADQPSPEACQAAPEAVRPCSGCRAPFHRGCASQHALSAAESGKLPLLCPVPGCGERWRAETVTWALSTDELQRYNAAVRSVRDMRHRRGEAEPLSPRTTEAMKQLGVRFCPQCKSPIEKQGAGLTHGCDKMTCRCGCKFCYRCGTQPGPGDVPRCNCVENHHAYLSHNSVMGDYADSPELFAGFPTNIAGIFNPIYNAGRPVGNLFGMPATGIGPAGHGDLLTNLFATAGMSASPHDQFRAGAAGFGSVLGQVFQGASASAIPAGSAWGARA